MAGLRSCFHNDSNWCFVNSFLQAMFHTEALHNSIAEHPKCVDQKGCMACVLAALEVASRNPHAVSSAKKVLHPFLARKKIAVSRQQDPGELWALLVDALPKGHALVHHVSCRRVASATTTWPCGCNAATLTEPLEHWPFCELKTMGGLSSVIVAELIVENALPVTVTDHASFCQQCGARANVVSTVGWHAFGDVVVLKIDRTLWEKKGNRWRSRKDARTVTVQDVLTVESKLYKLQAAIVHMGQGADCGHYVTWIVNGRDFVQYNDESATKHPQLPSFVHRDAVMLVYERINTEPQVATAQNIASESGTVAEHLSLSIRSPTAIKGPLEGSAGSDLHNIRMC